MTFNDERSGPHDLDSSFDSHSYEIRLFLQLSLSQCYQRNFDRHLHVSLVLLVIVKAKQTACEFDEALFANKATRQY